MKLDMQAAAARAEKAALERQLEEVQLSCAAGQADVAALKRDLAALDSKARTPRLLPPKTLQISPCSFLLGSCQAETGFQLSMLL